MLVQRTKSGVVKEYIAAKLGVGAYIIRKYVSSLGSKYFMNTTTFEKNNVKLIFFHT